MTKWAKIHGRVLGGMWFRALAQVHCWHAVWALLLFEAQAILIARAHFCEVDG